MAEANPFWGAPNIHGELATFRVPFVFLVLVHERWAADRCPALLISLRTRKVEI
jgi:hypothetical protein